MSRSYSSWLVLAALCVGQSVALMDTTAVNIAIPSMFTGINASLDQVLWVVNGYLLTYAVLMVVAGRLGDLYGQKAVYLGGLAVFTVASAACGLAGNPTEIIVARIVQGVGAALLTPQFLAILTNIVPPERRGTVFGFLGVYAGLAVAIGPPLGGLITATLGWRWVFFINVPIGVAAIVSGLIVVPALRGDQRPRLDTPGTALLTAAMGLVVYGLIEGSARHWGPVWGPITAPVPIVLGALLLVVFVVTELRRQDRDPLLPFALLRNRNFTLMSVVVTVLPLSLDAMLLLSTLYMQSALSLGALATGLTIAVAPLVSIFFAPMSGRYTDRYGGKWVLVIALVLFAGGIGYLALAATSGSSWPYLVPGYAIVGLGMGIGFSPAAAVAMADIEPAMVGVASGLFNLMRLCGNLLGGALVGAVLQSRLAGALAAAARAHSSALPAADRQAFVSGIVDSTRINVQLGSVQRLPAIGGLSRQLVDAVEQAVVRDALSGAVRFSFLVPLIALVLGALLTLGVRQRATASAEQPAVAEPAPVPSESR